VARPPIPQIDLKRLLGRSGFATEAKRIAEADAKQRREASARILEPGDVKGEYDFARLLHTTLGDRLRPITSDDLRQFAAAAKKLGKKYNGKITAKQVIEHSLPIDRKRANDEIRTAVVVRAHAGKLFFVTNAGPQSKDVRHHVVVDFPQFQAFAASPKEPKYLAKALLEGPLKFDCDCGRTRFWFRYIATIGGFNAGRPETGFPKIRNPRLVGVACKHALRVMQTILRDMTVRTQAERMLKAAQKLDNKPLVVKAEETKAAAQRQLEKAHHLRSRVESEKERIARMSPAQKARRKAVLAQAKVAAKRAADLRAKGAKTVEKTIDKTVAKMASVPLTKAQRDRLVAQLMAMKTTD
jgi:hypothetical protein